MNNNMDDSSVDNELQNNSEESPETESLMDKIRRVSTKVTHTYYDSEYDVTFTYKLIHSAYEYHEHMRNIHKIAKSPFVTRDENGNEIVLKEADRYLVSNVFLRTLEPKGMTLEHWIEICVKSYDLLTRYSAAISVVNGYISNERLDNLSLNK